MEPCFVVYKGVRCNVSQTLSHIEYSSGSVLVLKTRLGEAPSPYVCYVDSADEIEFKSDARRVFIMRGLKIEELDQVYDTVVKKEDVRAEAKTATFGRSKLTRNFKSGNGEGTSNNPILPHNEGFHHALSGHCFFYMQTCAPKGGENMLVPNHPLSGTVTQQLIEEYFYLTGHWLPFELTDQSVYPEVLLPYSITWFDQGVYDCFVGFLESKGLIPQGVSCDYFEQHIAKIGKVSDYPVSPIRKQLSPQNLKAFQTALEQSLILNLKEGDLIVFDNEQYMHARPPYQGDRKLVVAFSQKPRFLLPEKCQDKIRELVREKSYEAKALGLEDNSSVVRFEDMVV